MRGIRGPLIVASTLQIVLGFSGLWFNVARQREATSFDAGESFAMMAASYVALVESIGTFIAVSRYASATPLPPSVLSRGIGWKVASMGLSIPQYFNKYTAVNGFGPIHTSHMGVNLELMFVCSSINMPFSSEAFVVGLLATFLDVTLHGKDNTTRNDRGMHWWDKFRSFKTDTRSEEFYSLPFNLNKVLPISVIFGHSFEVIPSILTIVLTLRKKKKNICLWTSLALNLSP
ncbi:hypothetical protein V6N12_048200 [Hibiscus sabdariffa]|uniref:Uncharacterized protein n=1 Tax=Hibiscus sabdariffa TaxID=183260 RepID=A0ABR2EH08_9ROSI